MIDFFLLAVVVLLMIFGSLLCSLIFIKQDNLQLVQGAIILVIGFAIYPHAFPTADVFNPATDECITHNDAEQTCIDYAPPNAYGAFDIGQPTIFNLTHSWCRFVGKDGFNVAKVVERPCVYWEAKKQEPPQPSGMIIKASEFPQTCMIDCDNFSLKAVYGLNQSVGNPDALYVPFKPSAEGCNVSCSSNEDNNYCREYPSDTDKCECVKTASVGDGECQDRAWYVDKYSDVCQCTDWINQTIHIVNETKFYQETGKVFDKWSMVLFSDSPFFYNSTSPVCTAAKAKVTCVGAVPR